MKSQTPSVDFSEVQGLVRYGYAALPEACFLLLRVREAAAARAWLAAAPVTNAVERDGAPDTALQVALTSTGLRALGLNEEIVSQLSPEFLSGMAGEASRSRRLGDVGANAPAHWAWGAAGQEPHLMLLLYARAGRLEEWRRAIEGARWESAFELMHCLTTSDLQGREPFGFMDGVSQPTLDWQRQRDATGDGLAYSNLISLGEFVLGYPNEYGKYTGRPTLPDAAATAFLPPAEDAPGRRDFGKNGTYLVLRHLQQDVNGFWQYLDRQAKGNPALRQTLAEAMVGRKMNGEPLLPLASTPIAGIAQHSNPTNNFNYEGDGEGLVCPFGAHVRRGNPRTGDLPPGASGWLSKLARTLGLGAFPYRHDLIASSRFHRILRRGREYGAALTPEQAAAGADASEHGVQFLVVGANILRQFEFVQNAWMMSSRFNGLRGETDPLLGDRGPEMAGGEAGAFARPRGASFPDACEQLPRFVTVRGGAYFFLPSLSALRYLAR